MVGNCPVHGVFELQTEIAVSTMEAESITLSTAMQDLIPLQALVDKIKEVLSASSMP